MNETDRYIRELEELTVRVVQHVDGISFEELASFAEQREQLIKQLEVDQAMLTIRDKQRLHELCTYDTIILAKMEAFKLEASQWLLKQESIKAQRNAYGTHYTADSMFIDHKK